MFEKSIIPTMSFLLIEGSEIIFVNNQSVLYSTVTDCNVDITPPFCILDLKALQNLTINKKLNVEC